MAAKQVDNSQNLEFLSQRVENIAVGKASKEFVVSELNHVKSKLLDIEKDYDHLEGRVADGHKCVQPGLLDNLQRNVESNAQSIKKLYTWQASVGISLLVFFLTVGIAALRFVDSMDHSVQDNTKSLNKIESVLEKNEDRKEDELKDLKNLIKDAIKESK